jgi:hypothetical protein
MEPNQPGYRPRGKYDLRPILATFVVSLETRRRSIRNYETEDGTNAAGHKINQSHRDKKKSIVTNTVSKVLAIPKFLILWLM